MPATTEMTLFAGARPASVEEVVTAITFAGVTDGSAGLVLLETDAPPCDPEHAATKVATPTASRRRAEDRCANGRCDTNDHTARQSRPPPGSMTVLLPSPNFDRRIGRNDVPYVKKPRGPVTAASILVPETTLVAVRHDDCLDVGWTVLGAWQMMTRDA